MLSRAHLLIKRDFERFNESKPWGIDLFPLSDDSIFEWSARVLGPKDTLWEGGIFRIYVKFDEYYNENPPEVCFHTIPFHPNVDMITGQPCIDFLDNWEIWKEGFSLTSILLTIQMMLINPVMENAINSDAIEMMINSPHAYKQMVKDCVSASQRVEAGFSPHLEEDTRMITLPPSREEPISPLKPIPPRTTAPNRGRAKISFDDYYDTWRGIATSKAKPEDTNPLVEQISNNPVRQAAHLGLSLEEYNMHLAREQEDYDILRYGNFKKKATKPTEDESKQDKFNHINKMKKIYLQQKTPRTAESTSRSNKPEPWEDEVDDLVAWTNDLQTDNL